MGFQTRQGTVISDRLSQRLLIRSQVPRWKPVTTLPTALWCSGDTFLSQSSRQQIFSEKWALARPKQCCKRDWMFKSWKMDHNSWTLRTPMPGTLHWPFLPESSTSRPVQYCYKAPRHGLQRTHQVWRDSSCTADGCVTQLPCSQQQRACWELRLGQSWASRFLHLYSGQIYPFLCFTSDARDYIWVSAEFISLQYCVYVYYCRGAYENVTIYNDFPQENQNQNNNELA